MAFFMWGRLDGDGGPPWWARWQGVAEYSHGEWVPRPNAFCFWLGADG